MTTDTSTAAATKPLRELVPIAGREGQGRCRMHRRATGSGAQPGNRSAFTHGRYTRELLEFQRSVRELLRESAAKLERV